MSSLSIEQVLTCYHEYMNVSVDNPPTQKQFLQNLELKMKDDEFLGDTNSLLRVNETYDCTKAYKLITTTLFNRADQPYYIGKQRE